MAIDGASFGVTLPFGLDHLLLGQCDEHLVGILRVAQRDHGGGVDLVQDGDLGVHVRIGRKRIVFETLDRRFDLPRIAANRADGLHRMPIGSVRQFNGRVVPTHAVHLVGGDVAEGRAVGEQPIRGLEVTAGNVSAGIDRVDPAAGRSIGVGRRRLPPRRHQRTVARGHTDGHLARHQEHVVVLVGDLVVGLDELAILLFELAQLVDCLGPVGGIEHGDAEELRHGHTRCGKQGDHENGLFHFGAPFAGSFG